MVAKSALIKKAAYIFTNTGSQININKEELILHYSRKSKSKISSKEDYV